MKYTLKGKKKKKKKKKQRKKKGIWLNNFIFGIFFQIFEESHERGIQVGGANCAKEASSAAGKSRAVGANHRQQGRITEEAFCYIL